MTKEEAIERLKTLDCDCIYFNNGKCEYNTNKCQREQDIETALNMLKEKESKIKRLDAHLQKILQED